MIRIGFHCWDHSLLQARRSIDVIGSGFRYVKGLRSTSSATVARARFSNPRRSGNDRALLSWRLSDRKSRQRQRVMALVFEDSEAPDRGFPRQRLRYGVERRVRRASRRDLRHRILPARCRGRSRRVRQRR